MWFFQYVFKISGLRRFVHFLFDYTSKIVVYSHLHTFWWQHESTIIDYDIFYLGESCNLYSRFYTTSASITTVFIWISVDYPKPVYLCFDPTCRFLSIISWPQLGYGQALFFNDIWERQTSMLCSKFTPQGTLCNSSLRFEKKQSHGSNQIRADVINCNSNFLKTFYSAFGSLYKLTH